MADYDKFVLESQLFVSELRSAAPRVAARAPDTVRIAWHDVNARYHEFLQAESPQDAVQELKSFCKSFAGWESIEIDKAIHRYADILEHIEVPLVEQPEFDEGLSVLKTGLEAAIRDIDLAVSSGAGRKARNVFRGSTRGAKEAAPAEGKIEPALHLRLLGGKVKGRVVEAASQCRLAVEWGVLANDALIKVVGKQLQRARDERLQVVFALYSGKFEVTGGNTRIATRFQEDGFETPVEFILRAPTRPAQPTIFLEIEIHGLAAQRIPLTLEVVERIDSVTAVADALPLKVDIDQLIAQSGRAAPAAILRIASAAATPVAELEMIQSGQLIACPHEALSQTSLANYLGKLAARIDGDVARHPIWNELADPLKPNSADWPHLVKPLGAAAAAGSALHAWLAEAAGMKGILEAIDALPPGSRIRVRTDNVALPWELIYPPRYLAHHAADIDVTQFWGYRFEFETLLTPAKHALPAASADLVARHRGAASLLTVVLNPEIDGEMPWKAQAPVSWQRDQFEQARGNPLSGLDLRDQCAEARRLLEADRTAGAFIYFYCHGGAERPFDPDLREMLQIDAECRIELDEVAFDSNLSDAPIVFLNSCSSGPLASVSFDSFYARFLHKGALGLITTSFTVPAPFAARFGCDLALRYLKGEGPLGALLLDLRRKALDGHIPLGLFYMLRCPADVSRSVS